MALGFAASSKVRGAHSHPGTLYITYRINNLYKEHVNTIQEEPNRYARKIIKHLYHLFVPRKGEGMVDLIINFILILSMFHCHANLEFLERLAICKN